MSTKYCPFLNDLGGFFSSRLECRRTEKRIETSDPVYKIYCSDEHNYEKCPNFLPPKDDGDCYLTSACTQAMGLKDDCRELTQLRSFRDNYLAHQSGGREEIAHYYAVAPKIVAAIQRRPDALLRLKKLYDDLVLPCCNLMAKGYLEETHALYREKALQLEKEYL